MQSKMLLAILSVPVASGLLVRNSACLAEDVKNRAQFQNKLAGVCVDMCKEVGAFPKCTCPDFVAPDSTPGVMTWPELLEHMDNLSEWGHGELKAWTQQASFMQGAQTEEACLSEDTKHRMQVQNKLAGVCVDMCKEVGAFPKCTCPDFVAPDSTPGVMTWPELLEHMDNLSEWGHGQLKGWTQQASFVQGTQSEKACLADDSKHRMQFQNKLAGVCIDMCKEVGAFPKCTCPDFVAPDSTPGVMTWPELLEHMDNLSEWGHGELKAWTQQASFLQGAQKACITEDLAHRAQVQNKLAGVCVDMCKEVGAFPKCTCPDFVAPDSTPGVMTWPELLEHMDNLSEWGHGQLKGWTQQASFVQGAQSEKACLSEDMKHRMQVQNKIAGVCVDMCKEVGAFPKCTCPDFVAPDSTPGVMTWPELLEHMDNLSEWGHGELKAWTKQASFLQAAQTEKACLTEDIKHRMQLQNKLAGVCVDMCKEVGAFPKCTCPDFVAPDSTPGVMTWPELLEHMDNLSEWGHGELKSWTKTAR